MRLRLARQHLVASCRRRAADGDLRLRTCGLDPCIGRRRELRVVARADGSALRVELGRQEELEVRLVPDRVEADERIAGEAAGVAGGERPRERRQVAQPRGHEVRRLVAVRPLRRPPDREQHLHVPGLRIAHELVEVVEAVGRVERVRRVPRTRRGDVRPGDEGAYDRRVGGARLVEHLRPTLLVPEVRIVVKAEVHRAALRRRPTGRAAAARTRRAGTGWIVSRANSFGWDGWGLGLRTWASRDRAPRYRARMRTVLGLDRGSDDAGQAARSGSPIRRPNQAASRRASISRESGQPLERLAPRSGARARASGRAAGRSPPATSAPRRRGRSGAAAPRAPAPEGSSSARVQRVLGQADLDLLLDGALFRADEVAERGVVVVAEGLVEARDGPRGLPHLVEVLEGELRRGRRSRRRSGGRPSLAPSSRSARPIRCLALGDVDGDADRARLVRDAALHGLADPPRRIRGELEAAAPVELLRPPGSARSRPPGSGRGARGRAPGSASRSRRRAGGSS